MSERYVRAIFGTLFLLVCRKKGCLFEAHSTDQLRLLFDILFSKLFSYSEVYSMKPEIHPAYTELEVTCSCGNKFTTKSTLSKELHVDVCSDCHPFYTGKQKIIDTGGRIDKFRKKFGK